MTAPAPRLPDLSRDDISHAVVTRWETTAEQQLPLAEGILRHHRQTPARAGLEGTYCFVSARGDAVLTYQQWTDLPGAITSPVREPADSTVFIPYRGVVDLPDQHAECIVLVTFEFPSAEDARLWCDLLMDAVTSQDEPTPGCISRHLALSTDGRTVLNHSQWLDAEDHARSLRSPAPSAQWRRVDDFEGLTHGPGARCRLHGAVMAH